MDLPQDKQEQQPTPAHHLAQDNEDSVEREFKVLHRQLYKPQIPLTSFANTSQNVACISFLLGAVFMLGLILGSRIYSQDYSVWNHNLLGRLYDATLSAPVGLYMFFWTIFHLSEFITTATFNPKKASVSSFLINNGSAYHFAHGFAITEYIIEHTLAPSFCASFKHIPAITVLSIICILVGQFFRSTSMITAASNFSHHLVEKREVNHRLVTNGIYSFARHPSYLGFFWWVVGLQLLLSNPLSFPVLVCVTWNYFNRRIKEEEKYLLVFFGQEYTNYKKQVSTRIPFIP